MKSVGEAAMAIFHCDSCGHEQSVEAEHVGRTARCPECRHLSIVQDDPVAVVTDPTSNRFRYLALVALCGTIFAAQIFISRGGVRLVAASRGPTLDSRRPARAIVRDATEEPGIAANVAEESVDPDVGTLQRKLIAIGSSAKVEEPHAEATPDPTSPVASAAPVVHLPELPRQSTTRVGDESTKRPTQKPAVIDAAQLAEGKHLFEHEWQTHDKLAASGDGLGPVFNGRSCVECHFQSGVGGSGTNAHNVHVFEVLPNHDGGELREGVIHAFAINGRVESPTQVMSLFGFPKVPFRARGSNITRELDAVRTVFVNTPALWGNGLIDQISNQELINLEKTQPLTGHLRRSADGQIGKFGWKSQTATLHQFVGSACAAELGLSNSVRPQQIPQIYQDDKNASKDITDEQLTSLVNFVASIPAPRQVLPADSAALASVHEGNKLFTTVGCATCHVRDVGVAAGVYSDFRLHLIATGAESKTYYEKDAQPVYTPGGSVAQLGEWKTAPLWGVADTPPYWHDGSAVTLRDAILKHAEEGQYVADRFRSLGQDQQQDLLAFLGSLKAPDLIR
jgi:CxxC motif-containing protein (DUF1111 family)/DNA-directed RNA polymerase subunit RPC12/RpoP